MWKNVWKQQNIFWYGPVLIAIAAALWALDGITRRSLYHLLPIIIVFLWALDLRCF